MFLNKYSYEADCRHIFQKNIAKFLKGASCTSALFSVEPMLFDWSFFSDNTISYAKYKDGNYSRIYLEDLRDLYYMQIFPIHTISSNSLLLISSSAVDCQKNLICFWLDQKMISKENLANAYVVSDRKDEYWTLAGQTYLSIISCLREGGNIGFTKLEEYLQGKVSWVSVKDLKSIFQTYTYFSPYNNDINHIFEEHGIQSFSDYSFSACNSRKFLYELSERNVVDQSVIPLGGVFLRNQLESKPSGLDQCWVKLNGIGGNNVFHIRRDSSITEALFQIDRLYIANQLLLNSFAKHNVSLDYEIEVSGDVSNCWSKKTQFNIMMGNISPNDAFHPIVDDVSFALDDIPFAWYTDNRLAKELLDNIEDYLFRILQSTYLRMNKNFMLSIEGFCGYLAADHQFAVRLFDVNMRISGPAYIRLIAKSLEPDSSEICSFNRHIDLGQWKDIQKKAFQEQLAIRVLGEEKKQIYKLLLINKGSHVSFIDRIQSFINTL